MRRYMNTRFTQWLGWLTVGIIIALNALLLWQLVA